MHKYVITKKLSRDSGGRINLVHNANPFVGYSIFLLLNKPTHFYPILERKRNEITNIIGDVYCPDRKCVNQKCLYMCTSKNNCKSSYECLQCNASLAVQNIPFMDQKHLWTLFGGDGTHVFTPKTARDYEREATTFRTQPMLSLKKKPGSNKNSL